MEYSSIMSEYLASKALAQYRIGRGFMYENVILEKTFTISRTTDEIINQTINVSRRSMTGILCLFREQYAPGANVSESFVNPDITSISINIDGKPNCLYSNGMVTRDLWRSIVRRFGLTDSVDEDDFYASKFALWIDLRTHPDNHIHGNGLALNETRDGVKLQIRRQKSGTGTLTCYMFVVADAVMAIMNSDLKEIVY